MTQRTTNNSQPALNSDALFLPDFCHIRVVFAVVLVAELLAFVLTLADPRGMGRGWDDLGLTSLFIQWVALSSTALLCLGRSGLARFSNTGAGLVSYLIVILDTAMVSEVGWWAAHTLASDSVAAPGHVEFLLRNLGISAIVTAVTLRYFYIQHQWRVNLQAESRARLQALQARIRPHFLFNSLNTIASLTRSDPAVAEEAVENLADLFRVSLSDARALAPLENEIALTRGYLHIEGLRLGERLRVEWVLSNDLPVGSLIPPLTLQPLVENAIYHGIEPLDEGGIIRITVRTVDEGLEIEVSNPLPSTATTTRTGLGMAMGNIRERVAAHYGVAGRLEIIQTPEHYTARLCFPPQPLQQESA